MTKPARTADHTQETSATNHGQCFVIMPISDPDGYEIGHFKRVCEDIFAPAIRAAGFIPERADGNAATNVIQLEILRKLLDAPMALCDLSSRNPNVLFELGLRQAFDKPVVLVQEEGTPAIFDITPLRYTLYRRARLYHEVLADQENIQKAIEQTRDEAGSPQSVNSLVKLLGLSRPASIPEVTESERDPGLQLVHAELAALRRDLARDGRIAKREAGKALGVRFSDGDSPSPEALAAFYDMFEERFGYHLAELNRYADKGLREYRFKSPQDIVQNQTVLGFMAAAVRIEYPEFQPPRADWMVG